MILEQLGEISTNAKPLKLMDVETPSCAADEVLIRYPVVLSVIPN